MVESVSLAIKVLGWIFRVFLFLLATTALAVLTGLTSAFGHRGVNRLQTAVLGRTPVAARARDDAEADPAAESLLEPNTFTIPVDQNATNVASASTTATADATIESEAPANPAAQAKSVDKYYATFIAVSSGSSMLNAVLGFCFLIMISDTDVALVDVQPGWFGINYIWQIAVAVAAVDLAVTAFIFALIVVFVWLRKLLPMAESGDQSRSEAGVELGTLGREDQEHRQRLLTMEDGGSGPPPEYDAPSKN